MIFKSSTKCFFGFHKYGEWHNHVDNFTGIRGRPVSVVVGYRICKECKHKHVKAHEHQYIDQI